MVNKKLNTKKSNPGLSHLYSKFKDIKLDHCKSLLVHLYENKGGSWVNPLTGNNINNGSYVIISFLSKCYYVWGAKSATINSIKLKYKKHIEKFIAKEYLFDIPMYMRHIHGGVGSPKIINNNIYTKSIYPIYPSPSLLPAARRSPSPSSPPAARGVRAAQRLPSPRSPPPSYDDVVQAAQIGTPFPNSPPNSSPSSPLKFMQQSITISKNTMKIFNENPLVTKIKEKDCEKLLKNIKKALGNKVEVINDPLEEEKEINIRSPKLLNYLSKCYYSFGDPIKKKIEKIVDKEILINIDELADIERKHAQETANKRLVVQAKLAEYEEMFNKYCDDLKANCDVDGILANHKYISDVVNAILVIIYTKFLHLEYLYDDINNETFKNHLRIYMSNNDNDSDSTTNEMLKNKYKDDELIYQKNDLTQYVNNKQIDLKPNTIERYYENTLLNRQYVFEIFKKLSDNAGVPTIYTDPTIHYNKINTFDRVASSFKTLFFPVTLEYAETQITRTPFNYNITNSVLPKLIEIDGMGSITTYFKEDIKRIKERLATLPRITGIKTELTKKHDYYEGIITDMKNNKFGDDDIIRKNILYSLNAQTPAYIQAKYSTYKDEIYYNSKFTGTFPIFTWIPISSEDKSIYNFPNIKKWQPFGHSNNDLFENVGTAYKNYGIQPFSKSLNETIYKVISGEYSSIHSIDNKFEQDKMNQRINETLGAYKDLNKDGGYTNKKIYLYHGTNKRLHNMKDRENDIEILGFLSTTLNINTASVYSDIGVNGKGFIYIIEVDNDKTYINLNDHLHQFILLPHSIIRVVQEFNFGEIIIVLCSLIETPTTNQSKALYNKLLNTEKTVDIKYFIEDNEDDAAAAGAAGAAGADDIIPVPICAKATDMKVNKAKNLIISEDKVIEIFKIRRDNLVVRENILEMSDDLYVYFSLLQENEYSLSKGLPVIYGGSVDMRYSIHQHFIKDCYKYMKIPCIDYIFIYEPGKNIATGLLLEAYKQNRKPTINYDINNFFIDRIFNFDSIENKKLDLHIEMTDDRDIYADDIEGFKNAGLYIDGDINPLFRFDAEEQFRDLINYVTKYKTIFSKYSEASKEDLKRHFKYYNAKMVELIAIIDYLKDQYLKFIDKTLKITPNSSIEKGELKKMINLLADNIRLRALFIFKITAKDEQLDIVQEALKGAVEDAIKEVPIDNKYENAIITDLILDDEEQQGGKIAGLQLHSRKMVRQTNAIQKMKKEVPLKNSARALRRQIIEDVKNSKFTIVYSKKMNDVYKNVPISYQKSVYKFQDLPKDFQEYYGKQKKDTNIDISNSCHIRLVPRKSPRTRRISNKAHTI